VTHIKHRIQRSSFLATGARAIAAILGSLAILAAAVLLIGTGSGRAETACTLRIESLVAPGVHATRVEGISASVKSASETVHYSFEYAASEEGPWKSAGSGTAVPSEFEGTVGAYGFGPPPVHNLSPETTYFLRLIVENGCTTALKQVEFKTTGASAPEVINLTVNQIEAGNLLAIGMEYADFEAEIEGNGAEVKYQFEIKKEDEAAWAPASGTGTSGTVTVAGDFVEAKAHITGLTPETKYDLRVVAKSAKGEVESSTFFPTAAHHPEASISGVGNVTANSALVHGSVVPRSSETHWGFEYASSEGGPWTPGPEGTISAAAGEGHHPVEGELTGLNRETTYYVRLHADNGNPPAATSGLTSFQTAGSPVVLTFEAHTYVPGGETIRVLGSVEPHGSDTHYHFEYVSQEAFAVNEWASAASTPEHDAGSGPFSQGYPALIVGEDLPGLQSGKTYHYRLVASNAQGTVNGADRTLTVPVPAPAEEPACANESLRSGPSSHLPDCRAYEQVTPAEKKGSMDNWTYSGNVSTPVAVGEDGEHVMVKAEYSKWGSSPDAENTSYFFTREAGKGWQMTSATPQPQAGADSYRPGLFDVDLTQVGLSLGFNSTLENVSPKLELLAGPPGGPYTLVTSAPRSQEPKWVAASPDFTTLILSKGGKLSEWSGGELHQISGCPATIAKSSGGGVPGGAVSQGGSRVFFEAAPGCSGESHLYMRVDHEKNVDLGAYRFLAANAVDSSVLVERHSGETYEYLIYDVESKTAKPLFSARESLNLKGSRELSVIYFATTELLTPEAPPLSKESEDAPVRPEDLYRYDVSEAKLRFIVQGEVGGNVNVSSDGRYAYFEAPAVTAVFRETEHQFEVPPGGPFVVEAQVYRYDSGENVVQCMSCASPFAPRPQLMALFLGDQEEGADLVPSATVASDNGDYVFFDTASALVPQDVDGELHAGTHNYFTEEHDFSYSPSSDVYEWRKNGVDGCARVQGCLALISSGTGGLKNVLLGTTSSGRDVFFATHSQLVGQDTDGQGDVYDARIGGGLPPPAPPGTECEGDACVAPLAAPIDTTPASLSFAGPGNPTPPTTSTPKAKAKPKAKPCKKGTVRSKGRCVKRKPQKRGKRASRARRAARHRHGSGE
jgi:hypothetical protein